MEKIIASGEAGSIVAKLESGVISLSAVGKLELGGGAAKGIVSLESANTIKLSTLQAADLGLLALEDLLPSFKTELELLKGLIDAEIAKL